MTVGLSKSSRVEGAEIIEVPEMNIISARYTLFLYTDSNLREPLTGTEEAIENHKEDAKVSLK